MAKSVSPTKFKFKVVSELTLPVLTLNENDPAYIRIDGPVRVGKPKVDKPTEKSADMAPITLLAPYTDAHGTEFAEGAKAMTCIAAIFKARLDDNFPTGDYVGKSFEVVCTGKIPQSRAKGYNLKQIEPEA